MRILVYGLNYSPELTGIGKYTGEMCEWLASRGHSIHVITAPPYYPDWEVRSKYRKHFYQYEKVHGISVWRCPLFVPRTPSGLKRVLHLISFFISSIPILFFHLFYRPQVVLVVSPSLICAPGGWILGRLIRARTWLHVQDFEVDAAFSLGVIRLGFMRKLAGWYEAFWVSRFDRVSSISQKMLDTLLSKGSTKSQSIFFPNWIDTAKIYPINSTCNSFRKDWGIPDETCVALYSGNIGEKQGLEIIINAAQKLRLNRNIIFVICGNGSALFRLQSMAKGLTNIKWLPLQSEDCFNELLNAADIHLLPQLNSVSDLLLPSKLSAILASARPVVATAEVGSSLFNATMGCGISVRPGSPEKFAEAIIRLALDPEYRHSLGQNGRRIAVDKLEKMKILEKFESDLIALVD